MYDCICRIVAIVFQKRIVVLDAGSLENRFVIKSNSGKGCRAVLSHELYTCFPVTRQLSVCYLPLQSHCSGHKMAGLLRDKGKCGGNTI